MTSRSVWDLALWEGAKRRAELQIIRAENRRVKFERIVEKIFRRHFKRERKTVSSKLISYASSHGLTAAPSAETIANYISNLQGPLRDQLIEELGVVLNNVATGFGSDIARQLGKQFPGIGKDLKRWIKTYGDDVAGQISDTSAKRLSEAVLRSAGQPAMIINTAVSEQFTSFETYRSVSIAKTVTGTVARTTEFGVVDEIGVDTKKLKTTWITMKDERVRPTHKKQHGMIRPYGKKFPNGLRFPQDPDGDLSETAGCRCYPIYT